MELVVFFSLFLPFIPTVAAGNQDSVGVSIATAYDAEIIDGWARYVYWQHPDGRIMIQSRHTSRKEPEEVQQAVTPRKNSPLAACYRGSGDGTYDLVLSYLDDDGHINDVACRHHQDEKYTHWSTTTTNHTSSSGLAVAEVDRKFRRFYLDDEDFVAQAMDGNSIRLGPKAVRGSQVAAVVPVGSTNIHVFFVSDDMSLASLTLNGSKWSAALPAIAEFASDPKTGFAAAAWSDPSIVRIFYINQDRVASEWTFDGGSWANTTDTLPKALGARAGEPVAASRSGDGSKRYLEYFYTTAGGRINYLARNSVHGLPFQNEVANVEVNKSTSGLSRDEKIGLGVGLGVGLCSIIIALVGLLCQCIRSRW